MSSILNTSKFILFPILIILFCVNTYGELKKGTERKNQKITIIDRKKLDVNQISAYFRNDGEFYSDHTLVGPGFEWPKESGLHAIFSAGLWIGGLVSRGISSDLKEIRVATVGHFDSEYKPGKILSDGTYDDFRKPEYRYYNVRPKLDNPGVPDYAEWPVNQGAPYHDVNGNGVYEPYIDKPAVITPNKIIYPDMMLFAVYNDANPFYHISRWGSSKPLGVEVRQINYAFEFGIFDAQFIKFQIHNKSNTLIDSMYLTFWCDPDIGDAYDDYVGCDTTFDSNGKRHNLGYAYNGDNVDGPIGYGLTPPAVGVKLFQGPLLYTGSQFDTAIAFGKRWIGYKNGELSSFNYFCNPNIAGCIYPYMYDPSFYAQTYNIMKGLDRFGVPQTCEGDTVKFVFSGNPVTGTGCNASDKLEPSDLRFVMTTGPLTMAPGDSQEVVYAVFITSGTDNLNSITKLKEISEMVQMVYDNNFAQVPLAKILPPNLFKPPFLLNVRVENALSVLALLKNQNDSLIGTAELYDDGNHNDSLSNDGIWGNWLNSRISPVGAYLSLQINYRDGRTIIWDKVITNIVTIGKPEIIDFDVISDDINGDKIINPSENIRFRIKLKNTTEAPISNMLFKIYKTASPYIKIYGNQYYYTDTIQISETSNWIPDKYFELDVSNTTPDGHIADLIFRIQSINHNQWFDTISIAVKDFKYRPIDTSTTHISGMSDTKFGIRLVDYSKLKDNEYKITITKLSKDDKRYNLINVTLNDTLFRLQKLPSDYLDEHMMPIVDGFKLLVGRGYNTTGFRYFDYSNKNNYWFTGIRSWATAQIKYGMAGFASYPDETTFGYQSGYDVEKLKNIIIKFSNHQTQKAYRYIYGFWSFPPIMRRVKHPEFRPFVKDSTGDGFLYQDYEKHPLGNPMYGNTVPFTVWETDKNGNIIRQLDIGIVERNDSLYRWVYTSATESTKQYLYFGNIDGKWNPSPYSLIYAGRFGDELLLIFGTTYTDTPKTIYTGGTTDYYIPHYNLLTNFPNVPTKCVVWMRRLNLDTTFAEGDVLTLYPYYPITENDVYVFNPYRILQDYLSGLIPKYYVLYQNYPNPFNSTTTIRYDVATRTNVEIIIYDLLGRKIQTLVKEEKNPGTYEIVWDGRNKNGVLVSSGVYIVKYIAGPFMQSRKILLLR